MDQQEFSYRSVTLYMKTETYERIEQAAHKVSMSVEEFIINAAKVDVIEVLGDPR